MFPAILTEAALASLIRTTHPNGARYNEYHDDRFPDRVYVVVTLDNGFRYQQQLGGDARGFYQLLTKRGTAAEGVA